MSTIESVTRARAEMGDREPMATVFYSLDGVEHGSWVPPGTDRWDHVARAVGTRLRCEARAEAPPTYDTGTRSWTLELTLFRRRRPEILMVPVRWR